MLPGLEIAESGDASTLIPLALAVASIAQACCWYSCGRRRHGSPSSLMCGAPPSFLVVGLLLTLFQILLIALVAAGTLVVARDENGTPAVQRNGDLFARGMFALWVVTSMATAPRCRNDPLRSFLHCASIALPTLAAGASLAFHALNGAWWQGKAKPLLLCDCLAFLVQLIFMASYRGLRALFVLQVHRLFVSFPADFEQKIAALERDDADRASARLLGGVTSGGTAVSFAVLREQLAGNENGRTKDDNGLLLGELLPIEETLSVNAYATLEEDRSICYQPRCGGSTFSPIAKMVWARWKWRLIGLACVKVLIEALGALPAVLLRVLLDTLAVSDGPSSRGIRLAWLLVVLLVLSTLVASFLRTHYELEQRRIALHTRGALSCLLYEQALKTRRHHDAPPSSDGADGPTHGKEDVDVINLMIVDTNRVADQMPSLNDLWSLPVQIGVTLYLLYCQVAFAFVAGLLITLLLIPVNIVLAKKIQAINVEMLRHNDERVMWLNEIISSIKYIKMCGWGAMAARWLREPRKRYVACLRWVKYLDAMCVFFWATTPVFVPLATFSAYVMMGYELQPGPAIAALALFNNLILPLNAYPWVLNGAIEAKVSADRLSVFFGRPGSRAEGSHDEAPRARTGASAARSGGEEGEDIPLKAVGTQGASAAFASVASSSGATAPTPRGGREPIVRVSSAAVAYLGSCHPLALADSQLKSEREEEEMVSGVGTDAEQREATGSEDDSDDSDEILRRILAQSPGEEVREALVVRSAKPTSAAAPSAQFVLAVPLFEAHRGSVVGLCGPSGSGKSTFLSALIGELLPRDGIELAAGCPAAAGLFQRHPFLWNVAAESVAYVSQSPFILNASIKSNVLFGAEYHALHYDAALRASSLLPDLEQLPLGDRTVAGEGGCALSGGQRMRVALARAFYADCALCILDDPFGCLDVSVAAEIMEHFVEELARHRGKAVLVATHNVSMLSRCDVIYSLSVRNNSNSNSNRQSRDGACEPRIAVVDRVRSKRRFLNQLGFGREEEGRKNATVSTVPLRAACKGSELREAEAALPLPLASLASADTSAARPPADSDEDDLISVPSVASSNNNVDIRKEITGRGGISAAAIALYVRSVGPGLCITVAALVAAMQVGRNGSDWFIAHWFSTQHGHDGPGNVSLHNVSGFGRSSSDHFKGNGGELGERISPGGGSSGSSGSDFLHTLALICVANAILALMRSFLFARAGLVACELLHDELLARVLGAPFAFFSSTAPGQIINRLSRDVIVIDDSLPFQLNILLAQAFLLLGSLVVIATSSSFAVLPCLAPLFVVYYFVQAPHRRVTREIKRVESAARTPVIDNLRTLLDGGPLLRAMGTSTQAVFTSHAKRDLDVAQQATFNLFLAQAWFSLRLQLIGCAVTGIVASMAVASRGAHHAASIGLAIAYAGPLTGFMAGLLGAVTETEQRLVSVERIRDYLSLPPEFGGLVLPPRGAPAAGGGERRQALTDLGDVQDDEMSDEQVDRMMLLLPSPPRGVPREGRVHRQQQQQHLPSAWPSAGRVVLRDITVSYGEADGGAEPVLESFSLVVEPGQRVAVCGRTGAGKSTVFNALLQLVRVRPDGGAIEIDGLNLADYAPDDVRQRLGVLPQEPFLFHGTVAENIDPSGARSEADILRVMRGVGLDRTLTLQHRVDSAGTNLSEGHRHLVSLARVLLKGPHRVVLLDEPSAAVCANTDRLLYEALSAGARGATIIGITHILTHIDFYDRVILMNEGRITDDGTPSAVLARHPALLPGA